MKREKGREGEEKERVRRQREKKRDRVRKQNVCVMYWGLETGIVGGSCVHQGGIWLELRRIGWIWIAIEKIGKHSRQQGQQSKLRSRNAMQMSWYALILMILLSYEVTLISL